jgi:hypothetical protein
MGKMAEYFPIEYSALILYDSQKDFLTVGALYGVRREDHPPGCNRRAGIISKVFESRQPLVIQNLNQNPLLKSSTEPRSENIHPDALRPHHRG